MGSFCRISPQYSSLKHLSRISHGKSTRILSKKLSVPVKKRHERDNLSLCTRAEGLAVLIPLCKILKCQGKYGFLYTPKNKDYKAPDGTLPPLLVKAHGGPTSYSPNTLRLLIQYFTSRGFAVLDVNYRGSNGFGTQYRNKLKTKWGIYDVDDCCTGAQSLADEGQVDKNCLCIDGGSAGGYTTLACLAFKNVFKAGTSLYGVADLEALVRDTHKFESRYIDNLVAPYSEETKKIYDERSPIHYVDKLNCAMAFFQGDEDKIVPPNQAEMMYEAVKAKGLPTVLVMFKGEQHGFRKAENIQTALDGEFYFFAKVFGFEPADKHMSLDIKNLKG